MRPPMTSAAIASALAAAEAGRGLAPAEALSLAECDAVDRLGAIAAALTIAGHGERVSFSKKVFIPLTQLCRDVCHYCTFAQTPRRRESAYLSPQAVLASVPPLVVVANTVRVAMAMMFAWWFGQDTAVGFFYGPSSLVLFGLAVAGMLAVSRVAGRRVPTFAR